MEVVARNLHEEATEKQIQAFFKETLKKIGVDTFHCYKPKGRLAILTIQDIQKARQFLNMHGQTVPGPIGFRTVKQKLHHLGRPVNCSLSNKQPDPFLLLSLKKEESDKYAATSKKAKIVPGRMDKFPPRIADNPRAFDINSLMCGQWTYVGADLAFATYCQEKRTGRIVFGQRKLLINLRQQLATPVAHQIEVPYSSIQSFTIGPISNPSITFSLSEAPKFLERLDHPGALANGNNLEQMLQSMKVSPSKQSFKRKRISAISQSHDTVVASCLCYRLVLSNANDISGIQTLKQNPMIPSSISWNTSAITRTPFSNQMDALKSAFTERRYGSLSFEMKFQMQKWAQNGYLGPSKVIELLGVVSRQIERTKVATAVQSVRNLMDHLPFSGPETEASDLSIETLTDLLVQSQDSIQRQESYSRRLADRYDHIASVHKATVTPAGTYLYGPEPEIKNRVLRKYSAFANYFLSVSFLDEDGEPLRFDRQTSAEDVYQKRYKQVLQIGINIVNRQYEFLGFSHSSLRSQTCWFMAPFILNGSLVFAQNVIQALGDFRLIRSPAKCAARIGQTFSQTFSSVSIPREAFTLMPDIERNGRTFSDGCGTCSSDVLQLIWKNYPQARGLKPTVLQIRFQGAKGMISLDTRLEGSALRLRPSMIKFGGTDVVDIEICGSALKPLPMYLNRQMIKILEDLDVPDQTFLALQADAVERLRMTTLSAINAASFLERNFVGKAARLPWLIRKLWAMGFSFAEDDFLRDTLELAVLIQLRELKHRSRIRVEKGVTLYGIMDETGQLQEDTIYCSFQTERGGQIKVIEGSVVITRSPALHPGDVQCVTAVNVPMNNPLRALHNVVVFSSRGQRDLPSQLSGGDLDGDLYNVIYDDSLYPKRLSYPADYPTPTAVDIGRPVTRTDMTDFFINFMENDRVAQIATLHQILADRSDSGTFDPVCIDLAELHSTAVDFSKTGVPVDFDKLPKYPRIRPDFQAPGPRVLIEKTIDFEEEDQIESHSNEENAELDDMASYEPPRYRYYESHKILGKLYRQIDEQRFFEQLQMQSKIPGLQGNVVRGLADAVWMHVCDRTALIQWHHYIEFAKDVKDNYEENLVDTMLQNSTHPHHFVSEIEVFSGNLLGKNGAQSKRQREFSKTMKEKHDRDIEYTVLSITRGDDGRSGEEALERSIACLYVACNTTRVRKRVGALVSFVWIAAAVCLKEVEKLPGSKVLR